MTSCQQRSDDSDSSAKTCCQFPEKNDIILKIKYFEKFRKEFLKRLKLRSCVTTSCPKM